MAKRKGNPFLHGAEASEMRRRLVWRQHWCWSSLLTYLLVFLCGDSCPPISETCFICPSNPPCYQEATPWTVTGCEVSVFAQRTDPGGRPGLGVSGEGGLYIRIQAHLSTDTGWNRQKQARPRGRWFGSRVWTPLTSPDEPKSWLEAGGNLGEACTTGLPHMQPAAARSTWSSCSAHGERPKQPENREDPTCTRTLAPWFGKQIYLKWRSNCRC